jgi:hypothetical protein
MFKKKENGLSSLDNWVAGHSGNTTLVVSITSKVEVTFHTPGITPAVLDEPVVLGAINTVSNNKNSVVKAGAAAKSWVIDSTVVELEAHKTSIHSNRDWSNSGRSVLEISFRSRGNVVISTAGRTNISWVELALSLNSSVWVAGFSVNTVVLDHVLESLSHETTIATIVALWTRAVDKVLFGQ